VLRLFILYFFIFGESFHSSSYILLASVFFLCNAKYLAGATGSSLYSLALSMCVYKQNRLD